ncbi:hypothetical protein GCM10027053_21480 [Intrasporangium mesophilum]
MSDSPVGEVVQTRRVEWRRGAWFNPPNWIRRNGDALSIPAPRGSDMWRSPTSGARRESAPALLFDLPTGSAIEVDIQPWLACPYDQAGVLIQGGAGDWVTAGLEQGLGVLMLGARLSRSARDEAAVAVAGWAERIVTVRVSRGEHALTVRARSQQDPWRLVLVTPRATTGTIRVGPYCAAPQRSGLEVCFNRVAIGPSDNSPRL